MMRRTSVTAADEDFVVLEGEARRRGVSLATVLREAVTEKAAVLRQTRPRPSFGIVSLDLDGTTPLSELSWRDEESSARGE